MGKSVWAWRFVSSFILIAAGSLAGMAGESGTAPTPPPALPKIKASKALIYPDKALRLGLEGKVVIAFDIDAQGRAMNSSMVSSDDDLFVKSSLDFVAGLYFDLPKDEHGAEMRQARYRIGFVFCLPPSSLDDSFAVPVWPIIVSASRIRGSPVRNPPAKGATGQCAKAP
jgi:TonB family protein